MEKEILNRRGFLQSASAAVFVIPSAALVASIAQPDNRVLLAVAQPISWRTTIVSENEPGDPLIISGTIFAPDGKTPLKAATLWVYQTDATGNYSPGSNGDNRYTRIHGQMRTGSDGRYEFRTIRPAPYPGRTAPAHIHAYVSAPGFPEYWIDNYVFEGDPFITEEARKKIHRGEGKFASILKLTCGPDGVLRGTRDIRIERCTNNCVRH